MKPIILSAIRLYQKRISPGLPPRCRYIPTCSQYALEAVEKYGTLKGSLLAAKRKIYGQYPLSENFYNRISIHQREKPGRSGSVLYRKQSSCYHQPRNIRQSAGPPKEEKSARFCAVQIPIDEENDLRKVRRNILPHG